MNEQREADDGLLNRGELEIELARFALKLARRVDDPDQAAHVATWIQDEATALIARVQPEHRPGTAERVRRISESLTGIEVQVAAAAYGVTVAPAIEAKHDRPPSEPRCGPAVSRSP